MAIVGAFTVPHPPIIIPEIGRGEECAISKTIEAYKEVAQAVKRLEPETIVVISPHTVAYSDYFHIAPGEMATGNFGQFGAPQVKFEVTYDQELAQKLAAVAAEAKIPAGMEGEREKTLDHGIMVPLYFINQAYQNYRLVRLGFSGMPLPMHYHYGMLLKKAIEQLGRRAVIIASGDLSHKLKKSGPYGLSPYGAKYDERVIQALGKANFLDLLLLPSLLCSEAAECGHRSFTIMAGAWDRQQVQAKLLSYEGPFGVGYGVCSFYPGEQEDSRNFLDQYATSYAQAVNKKRQQEDAYITLARHAIESYVREGKTIKVAPDLPQEMLQAKAGAFVSLHSNGSLRGCIGTIGPMRDNLAAEIIHNAISAATQDPRFLEVKPKELKDLSISVDVLGAIEKIATASQLDTKRYGVIVTKGSRTGLLLPNLEGIDSVEQQIAIARQKAGIGETEEGVQLSRFEVIRHEVPEC